MPKFYFYSAVVGTRDIATVCNCDHTWTSPYAAVSPGICLIRIWRLALKSWSHRPLHQVGCFWVGAVEDDCFVLQNRHKVCLGQTIFSHPYQNQYRDKVKFLTWLLFYLLLPLDRVLQVGD